MVSFHQNGYQISHSVYNTRATTKIAPSHIINYVIFAEGKQAIAIEQHGLQLYKIASC